jgi:hypothetical protein
MHVIAAPKEPRQVQTIAGIFTDDSWQCKHGFIKKALVYNLCHLYLLIVKTGYNCYRLLTSKLSSKMFNGTTP